MEAGPGPVCMSKACARGMMAADFIGLPDPGVITQFQAPSYFCPVCCTMTNVRLSPSPSRQIRSGRGTSGPPRLPSSLTGTTVTATSGCCTVRQYGCKWMMLYREAVQHLSMLRDGREVPGCPGKWQNVWKLEGDSFITGVCNTQCAFTPPPPISTNPPQAMTTHCSSCRASSAWSGTWTPRSPSPSRTTYGCCSNTPTPQHHAACHAGRRRQHRLQD